MSSFACRCGFRHLSLSVVLLLAGSTLLPVLAPASSGGGGSPGDRWAREVLRRAPRPDVPRQRPNHLAKRPKSVPLKPWTHPEHITIKRAGNNYVTLLNQNADLVAPCPAPRRAEWRRAAGNSRLPQLSRGRDYLRLAEFNLGTHESASAIPLLNRAMSLLPERSGEQGLARYDLGVAEFLSGRFDQARDSLKTLLKSRRRGYNRKVALMYQRHAAACAGYHASHAAMGIPEPPFLDPMCGVAGLAVCLKANHLSFAKGFVGPRVRHDGEGSDLSDLSKALPSLGLDGRSVRLDDAGLRSIPKPIVAHVEHDHFIAVVRADNKGVGYVCSDCGPWPGGEISLTWKQWRAMEADAFLAVARKGSPEAAVIDALPFDQAASHVTGTARALRIQPKPLGSNVVTLAKRLAGHAYQQFPYNTQPPHCGDRETGAFCPPWVECPHYCPNCDRAGPTRFDPVNLASGEEEYGPVTDLRVYNPNGPSFSFSRTYNSLSNVPPTGFGTGWTHNFNLRVEVATVNIENPPLAYQIINSALRMADGTLINFTPSNPTASSTPLPCTGLPAGAPFTINCCYGSTHNSFQVLFADETTWSFQYWGTVVNSNDQNGASYDYYYPTQITDRLGHYISLTWSAPTTSNSPDPNIETASSGPAPTPNPLTVDPLLTEISDDFGTPLMVLEYDPAGNLIAAMEPPQNANDLGHVGVQYSYPSTAYTSNVPAYLSSWSILQGVDTPVPTTGSATAPTFYGDGILQYQFGYTDYYNGDTNASETIPYLSSIEVPSPASYSSQNLNAYSQATIQYTSLGAVSSITDANLNVISVLPVDQNGGLSYTRLTVTTPSGGEVLGFNSYLNSSLQETKRVYDVTGPNSTTTPWTYVFQNQHDPNEPSSMTNGNGLTWNLDWDAFGHLVSVTTPKQTQYQWTYPTTNWPTGELTTVTETPSGASAVQLAYYDVNPNNGQIESVTTPAPYNSTPGSPTTVTTSYQYTATNGNVSQITLPANNASTAPTITFTYPTADPIGEPSGIVDQNQNTWNFTYDERGNLASYADPASNGNPAVYLHSFYYNYADQLIETDLPHWPGNGFNAGTRKELLSYLYIGGPIVGDEQYCSGVPGYGTGQFTDTYQYGAEGELTYQGGITGYENLGYDAAYHLTSVKDGNNNTTASVFDYAGRLIATNFPSEGGYPLSYSYDAASNLSSRTDLNGVSTNFYYQDADGLLSKATYSDGKTPPLTFTYDNLDRLTSRTDGPGSETTSYDNLDEPYSITTSYTGMSGSGTVGYQFYPDGSRQTMTAPGGTWGYLYDPAGNLTSMSWPGGSTNWTFDADNRVLTQTSNPATGVPLTSTLGYTVYGSLNSVTNTLNGSQISVYGSAVNSPLLSPVNVPSTVGTTNVTAGFGYDAMGRLSSESYTNGPNLSYVYDNAGNPTTFASVSGIGYNVNSQPTGSGFTYDNNGNPASYKGTALTFDAENRVTAYGTAQKNGYRGDALRGWTSTPGNAPPDPQVARRKVHPNVGQPTGSATFFIYDGDQPVAELNSSGAVTANNIFGANGLVARAATGSPHYYAFDLQGNATQYVTGSAVTGTNFYTAYGKPYSGTPTDPWGYNAQSGYYQDFATGLYHMDFRDYDPSTGRFLTRDPMGFSGGFNLYGYAFGSPMGVTDPSGLFSWGGFALGVTKGLVGLAVGFAAGVVVAATAPAWLAVGLAVGAAAYGGWQAGQQLYEGASGRRWSLDGRGRSLSDDERSEVIGGATVSFCTLGWGASPHGRLGMEGDEAWLELSPPFRRLKWEAGNLGVDDAAFAREQNVPQDSRKFRLSELRPFRSFMDLAKTGATLLGRFGVPFGVAGSASGQGLWRTLGF